MLDVEGIKRAEIASRIIEAVKVGERLEDIEVLGCRGKAKAKKYAFAGYEGITETPDWGVSVVEQEGVALTGDYGVAWAQSGALLGLGGLAVAGSDGVAIAGCDCHAMVGNQGTAIVGSNGYATAGFAGHAIADTGGTATAGKSGTAVAEADGMAEAGAYGLAAAGVDGMAAAGPCGTAFAGGAATTAAHGLSVARGLNVRAKGGLGSLLVVVEEDEDDYTIESYAVGLVDGVTVKADTWYTCKGGCLVEVEE